MAGAYEVVLELERRLSGRGLRRRRRLGPGRLAVGAVLELEECGVTLVAARGR